MALARDLATRVPIALQSAKQAIDVGVERDLAAGVSYEEALFASVFSTQDAVNGLESFISSGSRAAVFEGRRPPYGGGRRNDSKARTPESQGDAGKPTPTSSSRHTWR